MGTYFALVIAANLIQMFIVIPAFLMFKGFNPIKVAKGMLPALALAFFSKSSAATLPVTMRCAQQNLGEKPQVAQFVLPSATAPQERMLYSIVLLLPAGTLPNLCPS